MANNVQGVTSAFKVQMLEGIHNLSPGVQTLKAALFFRNSGIDFTCTSYNSVIGSEVTGTNYVAGGIVVPNASGIQSGTGTAFWTPSATLQWTNVTINSVFDCCLIYNATASTASIMVLTFPGTTTNATNFILTMPANVSTSALLQVN